jgi:hypothetical protein
MSNIFKDAAAGASKVQQEFLGENYSYFNKIRTPKKMGMGTKGTLKQMEKNIGGIMNYSSILVEGGGPASMKWCPYSDIEYCRKWRKRTKQKPPTPLGNKFFLKTGVKCKDKKTGKMVDRYTYHNNQADGNLKIAGISLGSGFSDFKGLVPSMMESTNELNPMPLFGAFMQGGKPVCRKITMEVVNKNDVSSKQARHVSDLDISYMDECWFPNGKNPVTGDKCPEGFISSNNIMDSLKINKLDDKPFANLYNASYGMLLVYLIYKTLY